MSLDRAEPNYFGAGPALLPTSVLQQAAKDLINYNGLGLGAGEISHRSADATKIINDTKQHLTELLSIPDTHEPLLLRRLVKPVKLVISLMVFGQRNHMKKPLD
ncbi:unnamed protein product [[Candida] boidinii]|nr:unnamed protein product [[Candida] boidinii]